MFEYERGLCLQPVVSCYAISLICALRKHVMVFVGVGRRLAGAGHRQLLCWDWDAAFTQQTADV